MSDGGPQALGTSGTGHLLRRYAAYRDPADLDALVRRFRPMARSLALRYVRRGGSVEDLEQIACVGLIKALQRFEPERGYAFTSYAVPTILGELKRSFRESAWVAHVPRSVQERSAKVREVSERLEAERGRAPSVTEIADQLHESEEDVLEAMTALWSLSSLSLDAPNGEDDTLTLSDRLGASDDGFVRAEDLAAIEVALPTLTEMQRTVLRLRFEEDLKQSEIAARLGVSQMQVSRLLRAGLERLQKVADHQSRPARHLAAA